MKADICMILAAGKGTRMGPVGEHLPKILWPIYKKSLLELQVEYAKKMGFKKVYINSHHCHDKIVEEVKIKNLEESVEILFEEDLLGSGGAIHNLAHREDINYEGTVLVLNGDLFFFREMEDIRTGEVASLSPVTVKRGSGYNKLQTNRENLLIDIIRGTQDLSYMTFSGISIVNLGLLDKIKGPSSFFETVADYKRKKVRVQASSSGDYWDFGTLERYTESLIKVNHALLNGNETAFTKFLGEVGAYEPGELSSDLIKCGDFSVFDKKLNYKSRVIYSLSENYS